MARPSRPHLVSPTKSQPPHPLPLWHAATFCVIPATPVGCVVPTHHNTATTPKNHRTTANDATPHTRVSNQQFPKPYPNTFRTARKYP